MPVPLRILIADNHTMTFLGMSKIVDSRRYEVLSQPAISLQEAQEQCRKQQPDVLLFALSLAQPLPETAIFYFRQHHPTMQLVLIDDGHNELDHYFLDLGVVGYLCRTHAFDIWQACFQAIACNSKFIGQHDHSVLPLLSKTESEYKGCKLILLTEREHQLLKLIVRDFSNKDMAVKMGLSESTVRNNLSALYKKMDVKGKHALVRRLLLKEALESGGEEN